MMMELLTESLPEGFEFYHLGTVQPARAPGTVSPQRMLRDTLAAHTKIGFQIQGEVRGALVIAFERELDTSTYSEMGNVIASRMASRLGAMISPPQPLGERAIERLTSSPEPMSMRVYVHRHEGRVHAVYAFLAAGSPLQGVADA